MPSTSIIQNWTSVLNPQTWTLQWTGVLSFKLVNTGSLPCALLFSLTLSLRQHILTERTSVLYSVFSLMLLSHRGLKYTPHPWKTDVASYQISLVPFSFLKSLSVHQLEIISKYESWHNTHCQSLGSTRNKHHKLHLSSWPGFSIKS